MHRATEEVAEVFGTVLVGHRRLSFRAALRRLAEFEARAKR